MMFHRLLFLSWILVIQVVLAQPYFLPNFSISQYYREQTKMINFYPEVRIIINAPSPEKFNPTLPTSVALFALPNGNTIEQTIGKVLQTGDDWHFDIQHIGAQTRFVRAHDTTRNYVTVYLETTQLSWPSWRTKYANNAVIIKSIVDSMLSIFQAFNPHITLTGHSGGGSFTFGYMNSVTEIPVSIERISFLDSDYNYDDATYGNKLKNWIAASPNNYLSVIAYNDSVALLNGQPVVSPTGGTWYRSKMMAAYLGTTFPMTTTTDSVFITYTALQRRICFLLKQNPLRQILHTVQVEKNGYIQGMFSGTSKEGVGYTYYGARAYTQYVQGSLPALLQIPPRAANAKTGSQFMQYILTMPFQNREAAILAELTSGNVPQFMRTPKQILTTVTDAAGASHTVQYEVLPDYLCIGSDEDFCRIPMGPVTAQKAADIIGAALPTAKLVDDIYLHSGLKLAPVTYPPVGNQNEQVAKFIEHNTAIEQQRIASGKPLGTLIGGTKKDVVLSNLITDPSRPDHVVIYGWHQLNGQPIQPVTNIHASAYVDYSHGIRFINRELLVDNKVYTVKQLLTNSNLYKLLSNESSPMVQPSYIKDTILPAPIKSFGFIGVDSTTIRLIMPVDNTVTGYMVYYGLSAAQFTDSTLVSAQMPTITGLQKSKLYYVKVKVVNSFGASAFSEVLAVSTVSSSKKIMIVNGFDRVTTTNTYNFIRNIAPEALQYGYNVCSATNEAVVNGNIALNDYQITAYILGEESTADECFSTAEQTKLKSYLQQGGKLLVTGSEIAWDLDYKGATSDKEFCYNYLKCQYVADAPNNTAGSVYTANGVKYPLINYPGILFDDGTHGTINVKYPDVIKAINGSSLFMSYNAVDTAVGGAAVAFSGLFSGGSSPGKVVVIGFPFETMYQSSQRLYVMQKLIQYFEDASGITDEMGERSFQLGQNYPNPFNPVTRISYSVPAQGRVNLAVYDILGRLVTRLVDEVKPAGNYEIEFDAQQLSSGVYFYSMRTEKYSAVKKMIVLR